MEIDRVHSERGLHPGTVHSGNGVRSSGGKNSELEREDRGCVVEASPLPSDMQEEDEANLNIESSNFLYLHNTHSFFNKKINLTGTM